MNHVNDLRMNLIAHAYTHYKDFILLSQSQTNVRHKRKSLQPKKDTSPRVKVESFNVRYSPR